MHYRFHSHSLAFFGFSCIRESITPTWRLQFTSPTSHPPNPTQLPPLRPSPSVQPVGSGGHGPARCAARPRIRTPRPLLAEDHQGGGTLRLCTHTL
eukprot:6204471-Pleurochrysis_carterae.AAC.1